MNNILLTTETLFVISLLEISCKVFHDLTRISNNILQDSCKQILVSFLHDSCKDLVRSFKNYVLRSCKNILERFLHDSCKYP